MFNVSGIKGELNGTTNRMWWCFCKVYTWYLLQPKKKIEALVIKLFKVFIHIHYQICVGSREKLFVKTSGQILIWIRNNSASASLIQIDLHAWLGTESFPQPFHMSQKLCTAVLTDVLKNYWALTILQELCFCKLVLFHIPVFWEKLLELLELSRMRVLLLTDYSRR